MSKPMKRFLTDDSTAEKLAVTMSENNEKAFLTSSEGSLFDYIGGRRYSNPPNLDVYLKPYTGDYLTVDRLNRPSVTLYQPILTIGIFTQPSVLEGLPNRLADRGILARFLYSKPKSMVGHRNVTPKQINAEIEQAYISSIDSMITYEPEHNQPITLCLTDDAEAKFLEFEQKHESSLSSEVVQDFLISWLARLPAQLLRIASLLHVAEYAEKGMKTLPTVIGVDTIEKVIVAAHYFTEHAKAAIGCIKSDEELEDAKYLWKVLQNANVMQFKKQDVWKKTKGKFMKAELLDNALRILEKRDYISIEKDFSKSGKPGTVISVNPLAKR